VPVAAAAAPMFMRIGLKVPVPVDPARFPGYRVLSGETEMMEAFRTTLGRHILSALISPPSPRTLSTLIQNHGAPAVMRIPLAAAALFDQSPQGSDGENLAVDTFAFLDGRIAAAVPMAMEELNRFPARGGFIEQELNWIKFLIGANAEGFPYRNCMEFLLDSDSNLESKHNYVQIILPSLRPSAHANIGLHILHKINTWGDLLTQCLTARELIRLNMILNAIRMLRFWGFRFVFIRNNGRILIVLNDNPNSPLHRVGNHNRLRATRLMEALRMFGCFELADILRSLLSNDNYRGDPSIPFWQDAYANTHPIAGYL
jgi:hypothetical protein